MVSAAVEHGHSHGANAAEVKAGQKQDGVWSHEHYHSHSIRHNYGQTYTYEHRHRHKHGAEVQRHALADVKDGEEATVRFILGKPTLAQQLRGKGISVGAVLSKVARKETNNGWRVEVEGQLQQLTFEEAMAMMIEVR